MTVSHDQRLDQGWWRDFRRGGRDTILPTHTWKRRASHRRPEWGYQPTPLLRRWWDRFYDWLPRDSLW